jgi:hypothetical protein
MSKKFKMPVRIDVREGSISDFSYQGGMPLFRTDTGAFHCNTAFGARYTDASGQTVDGMLTAAHCFRPETVTSAGQVIPHSYRLTGSEPFRLTVRTHLEPTMDLAFVSVTGVTMLNMGRFKAENGEPLRTLTGRRTKGTTNVKTGTTAGSFICFYGNQTAPANGQECGEVVDKEFAPPNYPIPTNKYLCSMGPVTRNCDPVFVKVAPKSGETLYSAPGDSGAPVFALTVAFGVLKGGYPLSGGRAAYFFYTSTDAAYEKGYSLVYGQ